MNKYFYFVSVLAVAGGLTAQTAPTNIQEYQEEIEYQSQAIDDLKRELESTRQRIQAEIDKEESAVKRVSGLEQEISVADRLVSELKREEQRTARSIDRLEGQITANRSKLDDLRRRYAARVVTIYKRGTLSDLESILSSTSWRQAIYRTRYLQIISDYDRQLFDEITAVIASIAKQQADLEQSLRRNRQVKTDRERQVADLRDLRRRKEQEIVTIRNNRGELEKQLQEQQEGIRQMEAIQKQLREAVESIERAERIKRQREQLKLANFAALGRPG